MKRLWIVTTVVVMLLVLSGRRDVVAQTGGTIPVTFTSKTSYGTQGVAITCTLAGLATAATRGCASVDNTTNKYLNAAVTFKVKSNAAGTSATGFVNIWAAGTVDGGTTWSDTYTGADAAITLTSPPNLFLIGVCNVVANATTYNCGPYFLSTAFDRLPDTWGIAVENRSGAALDATEANHTKKYQGYYTLSQ